MARCFAAMALAILLVSSACLRLTGSETKTPQHPAPFSELRNATMDYNGPSEDFLNLTEIRIGWFAPNSLEDPLYGDLWWAANEALNEANRRPAQAAPSFASLPVRLVARWAADPWRSGVSQLTRMVYDEQPLALLGSIDSASTHLAEQVVAKANLPLVSPISTDKTATLAGVSWMFSCAPDSSALARTMADAILAEPMLKAGKMVLLTTTDHESRMIARDLVRELSRRGRQSDFRYDLSPGAIDISEALRGTMDAKPAVVLIIAGPEDAVRLTKAVRAGLGAVVIIEAPSASRRQFIELAGTSAEDVRFPLLFDPAPGDLSSAQFIERFTAERHHQPDYTAAMTYDAVRMLVEAIKAAGPNRARIREVLAHEAPRKGIAGVIHFDGTGQNKRPKLRMGAIRQGAVVPVSGSQLPLSD